MKSTNYARNSVLALVLLLPLVFYSGLGRQMFVLPKLFVLLIFGGSLLASVFLSPGWLRPRGAQDLLVFVFLGLVYVSTAFSVNPWVSILGFSARYEGALAFTLYGLTYLAAARAFDPEPRRRALLYALVFSAAVVSAVSALQFFGLNVLPGPEAVFTQLSGTSTFDPAQFRFLRNYSTVGNRNFAAALLALAWPVSLSMFQAKPSIVQGAASAVIFAGLIATKTRGAWIGVALGAATWLYLSRRHSPREASSRQYAALACLMLAVLLLMTAADRDRDSLRSRFTSIFGDASRIVENKETDKAGTTRWYVWKKSLPLVLKRPFLGSGPDTFGFVFPKDPDEYKRVFLDGENTLIDKAHNEYLQLAVTVGLPALAVYLGLLTAAGSRAVRIEEGWTAGVLGGLVAYWVQAFFGISVVAVAPIHWALLGLISGYQLPDDNRRNLTGD